MAEYIDRLKYYIKTENIQCILYYLHQYKNIVNKWNLIYLWLLALDTNNITIIYIMTIAKNHAINGFMSCNYNYIKSVPIEYIINFNTQHRRMQLLFYHLASLGNIVCIKIASHFLNIATITHSVEYAMQNGHVNFAKLWTNIQIHEYKIHKDPLQKGYRNVAIWYIANNKRIIWKECFKTINNAILLLFENGLIAHKCFTKEATAQMRKMGYIIKNKYTE